jgi:hypothetical protein
MLKIEIGKTTHDFKMLLDGEDITDRLLVKDLRLHLDGGNPCATVVTLQVYADEVEIESDEVRIELVERGAKA